MAQTAKTIVSTVNHGTLSTLTPDGVPLGTYVAYVLDPKVRLLKLDQSTPMASLGSSTATPAIKCSAQEKLGNVSPVQFVRASA